MSEQSPNQAESDLHMEIERLRHDIGQYIKITSELATDIERLRAIRDELLAALDADLLDEAATYLNGASSSQYCTSLFNRLKRMAFLSRAAIEKAKEQQT